MSSFILRTVLPVLVAGLIPGTYLGTLFGARLRTARRQLAARIRAVLCWLRAVLLPGHRGAHCLPARSFIGATARRVPSGVENRAETGGAPGQAQPGDVPGSPHGAALTAAAVSAHADAMHEPYKFYAGLQQAPAYVPLPYGATAASAHTVAPLRSTGEQPWRTAGQPVLTDDLDLALQDDRDRYVAGVRRESSRPPVIQNWQAPVYGEAPQLAIEAGGLADRMIP